MRKYASVLCLSILSLSLSGCGLVEDAFKAGIIFAFIIIAIIALVIWLARMAGKALSKKYDLTWDEDEITPENSAARP
jgi:hypothetical protein